MKKFITLTIIISIIISSFISVYANNGEELSFDRLLDKSIVEEIDSNGTYVKKISSADLKVIKDSISKERYISIHSSIQSNKQSSADIMTALGLSQIDIDNFGIYELENLIQNTESIVLSSTYLHSDVNGNIRVVTREEYLKAEKNNKIATQGNSGSNDEDSYDGYFNIMTMANYLTPSSQNNEKGWYLFSGYYKFLTNMPDYRMIDAASLYADGIMWSQNNNDYYSTMIYSYLDHNGRSRTISEEKTTKDRFLYANGLYYKWKLPLSTYDVDNNLVHLVTDINIHVRGKARVSKYTEASAFALHTRYEHTYSKLNLQPSFSWGVGGLPGVSANVDLTNGSNTYTSLCEIDYRPSINY